DRRRDDVHRCVSHESVLAILASAMLLAACSSSATGSSGDGTSGGTSGAPGSTPGTPPPGQSSGGAPVPPGTPPASTDGGFDFTFTNAGANITLADLKVAPVYGAFCQNQAPNRVCSFTGNVTKSGCTGILNVGFVGTP